MAQYIGFKLGGEEYSIPILKVREIINIPGMTRLPRAPEYIEGVTNLRGCVIPVVNLKKLVRTGGGNGVGDKIIVLTNGKVTFGIMVDGITGVIGIDESSIEPPDRLLNGSGEQFVGIAKYQERLVVLLDTRKLLPDDAAGIFEDNVVDIRKTNDADKVEVVTTVQTMGGDVERRELRDARDFISKKIESSDPNQKVLEPLLAFMEAMAGKDYEKAEAVVQKIAQSSSEGLFKEVGKVTRRLHDSLKSFKEAIDPKISSLASNEVPNAIDRLQFVIDKTEEAANKTMGIVEKHLLGMDELAGHIRQIQSPEDSVKYLKSFKNALEDDLTEIITTQSFQDITGQTIKKVIRLVEDIEKELVMMVTTFGLKIEMAQSAAGPAVEKVSQGGVDDLLKEYGF
ncbi:MAG: protein phosphatase CheZ [Deltaproteobacteria bacterium]|nr:protein phosphatase CheZ [Deltaproteobacteria bacterium]